MHNPQPEPNSGGEQSRESNPLASETGPSPDVDRVTLHEGAELTLYSGWIDPESVAELWNHLTSKEFPWNEVSVDDYKVPRLISWIGDPGCPYEYSGLRFDPADWTAPLANLRERLEQELDSPFNTVLLNHYRDGKDNVGWHADNEPCFGEDPTIASISLGATRKFELKHNKKKKERHAMDLGSGDLLVMSGTTQRTWRHRIPAEEGVKDPRINLTFRHYMT